VGNCSWGGSGGGVSARPWLAGDLKQRTILRKPMPIADYHTREFVDLLPKPGDLFLHQSNEKCLKTVVVVFIYH